MSRIIDVTPSPRLIEVLKERGPPGPQGPSGVSTFVELMSNHQLTDTENGYGFLNTDATAMIDIDFSLVGNLKLFQFYVSNPYGIRFLPTQTIYIGGFPTTGPVYSEQVGASANALVVNPTTIFLQTFGNWSFD